ncbi:hypothetical protein GCM10028791_36010 [Echinicola sediminis]
MLKQQNEELKKINEELSSFNHIASHDLQEPLRKIQIFISRIEENANGLSSEIMNNFWKIQKSAERMQKLILDLLDFSRVSRAKDEFRIESLQKLANKAILDMAYAISEKDAKINVGALPNARVIPFQIVQLFNNLISNSLKYSKKDTPPLISIYQETVTPEDLVGTVFSKEQDLIKICVRDEGIGFDEEFSETIFEPFRRLHAEADFTGTGIGLAICRKIVHNHQGKIIASSKPNQGTVFTIIFPKET